MWAQRVTEGKVSAGVTNLGMKIACESTKLTGGKMREYMDDDWPDEKM